VRASRWLVETKRHDSMRAGLTKLADAPLVAGGADALPRNGGAGFPSFLSGVVSLLGGQASCAALAIFTEICYARILGPGPRGQISLCMMAIACGVLVGGLGGDVPIIIWTANSKRRPSEWFPAVLLWGLLGSVVASSVWVGIYWKWRPAPLQGITPALANLIAATIPFAVLGGYLLAVVTGGERFRLRAGLAVADQFAGLTGFLALLLLFGRKAETAVAGNLIGIAIGAGLTALALNKVLRGAWRVPLADRELYAGLRMGLRGQFGNLAGFLYYRLDVLFVNYFLGSTQVGLYALGVVISEALWQVPQAASAVLFPRTARTLNDGANEFTCLIVRQILLISAVIGLAIGVASPVVIPLVFGARFGPSVAVVWWILPGTIALSLAKVASADLAGRHKIGYSSIFASIALAVTLVLDWTLIPRMGIRGAALASSVAYFVDSALLLIALRYELKVTWKALLVPSEVEWESYRQAWYRCKAVLRPATANGRIS
jgi:O-antigen/teichoic acid export membrane protein